MQNCDSKISNLDCDTLSYKNSYGNAELKNMVCTKSLTMSFKNGDLRVSGMKSEIISYETSYGAVSYTHLLPSSCHRLRRLPVTLQGLLPRNLIVV